MRLIRLKIKWQSTLDRLLECFGWPPLWYKKEPEWFPNSQMWLLSPKRPPFRWWEQPEEKHRYPSLSAPSKTRLFRLRAHVLAANMSLTDSKWDERFQQENLL